MRGQIQKKGDKIEHGYEERDFIFEAAKREENSGQSTKYRKSHGSIK